MKTWKVTSGSVEKEIKADEVDINDIGALIFSNEDSLPLYGFRAGHWDSFELIRNDEENEE